MIQVSKLGRRNIVPICVHCAHMGRGHRRCIWLRCRRACTPGGAYTSTLGVPRLIALPVAVVELLAWVEGALGLHKIYIYLGVSGFLALPVAFVERARLGWGRGGFGPSQNIHLPWGCQGCLPCQSQSPSVLAWAGEGGSGPSQKRC
ncbi:hypothetical protein Syun_019224 [Stephania yunnanensis]|uniref:Uncharacterized protein n=1 Tax=Stephania yunnanensis TaxID=152371 RepID=A0AAP0IVP3_9MAGN